jgi:hypothetical protein
MPRRTIDGCFDVFDSLKDDGIKDTVSKAHLLRKISLLCGSSDHVRKRYIEFMESFELIKRAPDEEGDGITYFIEWETIDRLRV